MMNIDVNISIEGVLFNLKKLSYLKPGFNWKRWEYMILRYIIDTGQFAKIGGYRHLIHISDNLLDTIDKLIDEHSKID